MVSKEKKKKYFIVFLAFFLFSGAIFVFSDVQSAYAGPLDCKVGAGFSKCWNESSFAGTGDILAVPFKVLVYALFVLFGWFASVAITLFQWALTPGYISGPDGLLNHRAIYEMWKFIRDFFNLFFILVLLYIAFTVVFQIQKNFKKALLGLVLAALLVNFSFPISEQKGPASQ